MSTNIIKSLASIFWTKFHDTKHSSRVFHVDFSQLVLGGICRAILVRSPESSHIEVGSKEEAGLLRWM